MVHKYSQQKVLRLVCLTNVLSFKILFNDLLKKVSFSTFNLECIKIIFVQIDTARLPGLCQLEFGGIHFKCILEKAFLHILRPSCTWLFFKAITSGKLTALSSVHSLRPMWLVDLIQKAMLESFELPNAAWIGSYPSFASAGQRPRS